MSRIVILFVLILGIVSAGQVWGDDSGLLKYYNFAVAPFSFDVLDNVADGCFPNPNGAKRQLEAELRRNGFKIHMPDSNGPPPAGGISFSVNGFADHLGDRKIGCVAHWEFTVWVTVISRAVDFHVGLNWLSGFDKEYVSVELFQLGGIMSSPDDFQADFERKITESVRDFYLETQRAKGG